MNAPPLKINLEEILQRAIALQQAGKLQEAERLYRDVVCVRPEDVEANKRLDSLIQQKTHIEKLIALFNAGQYAVAERLARALVSDFPAYGTAWKILGSLEYQQGRLAEAIISLRRAVEIDPSDEESHNNLAISFKAHGQLAEAERSFRRAMAVQPDRAEIQFNLGCTLKELSRYQEAEIYVRNALSSNPHSIPYNNELGTILHAQRKWDEAANIYNGILARESDFPEVLNNLGITLIALGRFSEAESDLRRAVLLAPSVVEIRFNLGCAIHRQGRVVDAEICFRQVLSASPGHLNAHIHLGIVLKEQLRNAEAEASYRKALEIVPDHADALVRMGEVVAAKGDFVEAEIFFRKAIAVHPAMPEAWAAIARMRKMGDKDANWLETVEGLVDSHLPPEKEVYLRYALGKYFDDTKTYDAAFENFSRANVLTAQYGQKYDRKYQEGLVRLLSRVYDKNWVEVKKEGASQSNRPVLIIGMPRSGTSLAEQILSSHTAAFGAGELTYWKTALSNFDPFVLKGQLNKEIVKILGSDYLQLLQSFSSSALRVIDKMPHNFLFLGLIHTVFPQARFIHMQRNPIDTCLSIYFQHFDSSHTYSNDLDDIAHYYSEYRRMMAHWEMVLPDNVLLQVPYEELVSDQEIWTRKMLEFVDLPWEERCMEFHKSERTVNTASIWQVRQKMSKSSVERWRHYEKHVGPLMNLLGNQI
ncbi:tetratricopeptide repeat protein [Undibacterium sp. TJN25]|uniref:tetratricopeptide repeat protein n=1 Tax=Undibacterium sp. TJN25 TaxID=3413056 RepID=UPI003BF2AE5B